MPSIDVGLSITAINNATAPLREASDGVRTLGENAQATANRLKAIEVVIAGILIEKTLELGKAFVSAAEAIQNLDIRMGAWAGGTEAAQSILKKFNDDVGASGIKIDAMGNAFVRLRAAGVGQDQAVQTVENLVKGIAAVGGTDLEGTLENAASAFQRFSAKGVVSMRELNAIVRSTGLTVGEMAKGMGISVTEFEQDLKDKTLSAQQLLDGFNIAAQEKFGNFTQLLGSTVSGALSKFKNDFTLAFGGLGENTALNANIVAIVQNLDKAMVDFISHISQADIERFFKILQDMAPVMAEIGTLIYDVGLALISLGDIVARFLDLLPKEATEYGIIGYVLFGKVGALLGALFGTVDAGIRHFGDEVDQFMVDHGIAPEFFKQDKINNQKSSLEALFGFLKGGEGKGDQKNNWISNLVGTPEQITAIKAALADLQKVHLGGDGLTPPGENLSLAGKAAALQTEAENVIKGITGKDALLEAQNAGDVLTATIQGIKDKTDAWDAQLETLKTKLLNLHPPLSDQRALLEQIEALEKKIAADTDEAIQGAKELNQLKQQEFDLTSAIERSKLAVTQNQLSQKLGALTDPLTAAFQGSSTGQLQDEVAKQQLQYQEQIYQYAQKIQQLQIQTQQDPTKKTQNDATIAQLQKTISLTQQLGQATTTATALMAKGYQQLGNVLTNDIESGITGIISGTETWQQAARKLFTDMIQLAVKYLVQMIELQVFGETAQATTLAITAPTAAALTAMWSPAAMAASIASYGAADAAGMAAFQAAMAASIIGFADGGIPSITSLSGQILSGPTLFGIAGEAGTEAVMPLARIGGKLGVRTTGVTGGNTYQIHVHAIDTQTGLQFLAKHISDIDAGLNQNGKLNRRAGHF